MATMESIRFQRVPTKLHARWLPSLHELSPYDQGFARGYSDGWKKAAADCKQEMEEKIRTSRAHWDAIARALNSLPRGIIERFREQLVSLVFATVQKMLAATPITREEVAGHVKQMLEHVESGAEVEVQLHTDDLALLTEDDRGALWNEEMTHLKWTANPSVPRGGCVLQGEFGWIDGRRETRLKKLEQRALDSIKQTPS